MTTTNETPGKFVPRHAQRPATPVVSREALARLPKFRKPFTMPEDTLDQPPGGVPAEIRNATKRVTAPKVKLMPTDHEVMTASAIRREREAIAKGKEPKLREVQLKDPIVIEPGTSVQLAPYGRAMVRSVLAATISASGISHGLLVGPSRSHNIVHWRMAGMYLAKELVGASFPEIGRFFLRDHSTVLHAIESAEGRPEIMACVRDIKAVLR